MGKQRLDLIDRKESSRADFKQQCVRSRITSLLQECLPCVSPQSKSQMLTGRRHSLVSTCHIITFTLAELRKAKSVKFIRVWIGFFISMGGTGRNGDECACGDSHTIGKCKWLQGETGHGNWEEANKIQISYLGNR
jgi:hypothetical protein